MSVSRGQAIILASALMLSGGAAQAMEIRQFDKMAIPDQSDYIVVLVEGAQQILIDSGRREDAAKVHRLFTDVRAGDKMTLGMIAFEENLARARVADAERHAKDNHAARLEVEHAMLLTLKKNGITLPQSFMQVADKFRPKQPLR